MKSLVFGGTQSTLSTTATQYTGVMGTFGGGPVGTEAAKQTILSAPVSYSNLYVQVSVAPGAGASYTFNIMKNGVATGLQVVISGSNTSATDNINIAACGPGDLVDLQIVPSSGTAPVASTKTYWTMIADSGISQNFMLMGGINGLASTTATQYETISGMGNTFSTTELPVEIVVPISGTLQDLYVVLDGAPTGLASYQITVMQNGSASTLTTTISGTNTTSNDTAHQLTINAGDTLSIQSIPGSSPTARRISWSMRFIPNTDGLSFFGFGSANAPSASATNWEQPLNQGAGGWSATESARLIIPGACTITGFYALLGTAPGGATARTLTLRKNSASTGSIAATISGTNTTGNITGQSLALAQTDTLDLQASVSGSPAALTNGVHIGVIVSIPSPTYTKTGSTQQLMGV